MYYTKKEKNLIRMLESKDLGSQMLAIGIIQKEKKVKFIKYFKRPDEECGGSSCILRDPGDPHHWFNPVFYSQPYACGYNSDLFTAISKCYFSLIKHVDNKKRKRIQSNKRGYTITDIRV